MGGGGTRPGVGANPQVVTLTWLVSGEGSLDISIDFQRSIRVDETINVPIAAASSL
eukprot:SAG31_NODE_214_length_20084_cov_2.644684_9_plen_56_part_00